MITVYKTEYFTRWFNRLRDARARAKIAMRILQTECGNFGDSKSVGDGVLEMRIYYARENNEVVILLAGGDKSTQQKDIAKAKEIKNEKEKS